MKHVVLSSDQRKLYKNHMAFSQEVRLTQPDWPNSPSIKSTLSRGSTSANAWSFLFKLNHSSHYYCRKLVSAKKCHSEVFNQFLSLNWVQLIRELTGVQGKRP